MCGLCGVFNYRDKSPVDRDVAGRMLKSLIHRGPDDEGTFHDPDNGLYLGHRRLSIIDLATGHQPLANENETVWVDFNGEVYNFRELRLELEDKGHRFTTRSDTETIVHAYEQWGMGAFSRLNGIYAFALWDVARQRLILARDPYGVKPLYYWNNGKSLVFASEAKALFYHPGIRREVDRTALAAFISLTYVPSPRTAFRDIHKLPPGHILECDRQSTRLIRFYKNIPLSSEKISAKDLTARLQHGIESAVRRQMIADVRLGAMLSGGLDSSTLVAVMSGNNGNSLQTFTAGFEGNFKWNELQRARRMAKRISADHHEVIISADDYRQFLPRSLWYLEELISTGSTLALYMVCKLARDHVKVVLTGQGADEPFAGYPRHLGERYGSFYRRIPTFLQNNLVRPAVEFLPRNERLKRAVRSLGITEAVPRFREIFDTLDADLQNHLLREEKRESAEEFLQQVIGLWQADVRHLDELNQLTYVDSRLSLADNLLIFADKMSMAVSLEARVPFLDLQLMQFVESLPARYKIHGMTQKYLLKKAASRWIPRQVITAPKIGFTTPLDDWFQQELTLEIENRLLSAGSACRQYFQETTVRRIIQQHVQKRQDYKRVLFSLLTFELWHDQFIRPPSW